MSRLVITTYVLLFLLKLRFPKHTPFTNVIKNRYNSDALALYRKLEDLDLKIRKIHLDLDFLRTCKAYGILPKFLNFKLYKSKIKKTLTYKAFQFKLLNYEINDKNKSLKSLEKEYNNVKVKCQNLFSFLDFHCLYNRILRTNEARTKSIKTTHSKKLNFLGISTKHSVNKEKVVINTSKRKLTTDDKEVLSLGLSFALPKFKPDFVTHYLNFEKLACLVKHKLKSDRVNDALQGIKSIANDTFHDFFQHKYSFPKLPLKLYESLKNLKSDKSIFITRPDKGRGTVILDRSEYIEKVESILNDNTKFKEIFEDPFKVITKLEDRLARLLRTVLKLNIISKDTFNNLFSSGASPGVLYGLPKIHKIGNPIRPVLSTLHTFNYNLAKFFVPILEPLTTNEYTLKNSLEFIKEINQINLKNKIMASFDIQSLFTNIPLDETIKIIDNELFKDSSTVMGFTRKHFVDLLELSIKDSPFIFNDKVYTQIDGVSMGSCLGPTLANTFLCHHEKKWLSECPNTFKPLLYKRYVDDCFLLFDNANHVTQFLDYLNSKHKNIKFTYELEENGSLPFLDVKVTRNEKEKTETSVYRKPTFTGLGTNYNSFTPRLFKINAIKTLLYRCYHFSSNWNIFNEEIKFLTQFFQNNKYPLNIVENCISKFLNDIFTPKPENETVQDKIYYVKLPFYGYLSYTVRRKLNQLLKIHLPDAKFRFIFTNPFTIKSFFPHKDKIPMRLMSNIVYQYTCSQCKLRYLGESTRSLKLRMAEHEGVSPRTGHKITRPNYSAIRSHCNDLKHEFNVDNFKVLKQAIQPSDTKILEALLINQLKPELNNQTASVSLNVL